MLGTNFIKNLSKIKTFLLKIALIASRMYENLKKTRACQSLIQIRWIYLTSYNSSKFNGIGVHF